MANYIAPGVYVNERDFSDYIAAIGTTSLGLVGTAKRGPINTPTLCTNTEFYLSVFGEPSANHYAPYAALNYLKAGNQLWFNRVAKEFEDDAATIVSLGAADSNGDVFIINVGTGEGASFTTNDYVRITQTGKATTVAKIASINSDELTLATALLDTYDASSGSDSSVALAQNDVGTVTAEVFAYSRYGGAANRLVHFKARNPGDWANFGTRKGLEIVIEDGGQYANIDPVTGLTVEDGEGNPLRGVIPSVPSKDTVAELAALASSDDVTVNELRGVNYSSVWTRVSDAVGDGNDVTLTVTSSANFSVGDDITVSGLTTATDYNATLTINAITDATTIVCDDPGSGQDEGGAATDAVIAVNADSDHKGLVYRCTAVRATGSDWEPAGVLTKNVRVLYQGRQVELHQNLIGYDISSDLYWDNVIGTEESPKSDYITVEYLGNGESPINTYHRTKHPNNPRLLVGENSSVKVSDSGAAGSSTFKNTAGINGDNPSSADFVGIVKENGSRTGLQVFRQAEAYEIDLLASPGNSAASVINEILDICITRNDCIGIIDPPYGLTVQEVVDWHNGTGQWTGQHSAFVASQAALYYPWVKQFDPYTSRDMWLPPTCFIPAVYANSDDQENVWWAPAGIKRGTITGALATEINVQEGDIEYFYGPGNGNAINAISVFTRDGIIVNGQRTLQRHASALDRVNVRRLVFYITRSIKNATRILNFEQGDEILWGEYLAIVDPFMQELEALRAVEWFENVCNESTNPAQLRNRNEVGAKLYMIPTKSAEKLVLDLTVFASGATVNELIALDSGANLNV